MIPVTLGLSIVLQLGTQRLLSPRPFHDAKGPVMPSIWIRPFSDRNGYS